jgi:hypothetical protein
MLELLVLLLLAGVISVVLWYQSFQEFTILQVDYSPTATIPSEKVPIVLRGLPQAYKQFWSSTYATQSSLPVLNKDNTRTILKEYAVITATEGPSKKQYHTLTATELANRFHIHSKFMDSLLFMKEYWYLPIYPVTSPAQLWVLPSAEVVGLQRTLAERTVLTVHEGSAIVWLARETIPIKDIVSLQEKDPWSLSVRDFPFINDLQYIEVVLRAGNALILPPRSLYSLKPKDSTVYYSTIELHTPLSFFISSVSSSVPKINPLKVNNVAK